MVQRVMMVCTGNICRSPMAEVVLRERLEAAGLGDDVVVDSTGVSDEERGNPIDPRAVRALRARGYDPSDRAAVQVEAAHLAERDLVLAMTASHARALRRLDPDAPVRMFRSFDPEAPEVEGERDESRLDVADPWYGGPEDFELCLDQVEGATDGIIAHLRATSRP